MEYNSLEEEFEATCDEMQEVNINDGDEVLYWDVNGDNDCHTGKIISIVKYHGDRYEPSSNFYEIEKDDGSIDILEDEYVIKRKWLTIMEFVNGSIWRNIQ